MTATAGINTDFSRGFELLKRIYADKVEDLVPESDKLGKDIPFITAEKQPGQDYYQPVTLTREQGFTWWNTGAVQTLNQPISTQEVSASIRGAEIADRAVLSYKFLHAAMKQLDGTSGGMRAFVNATKDRFAKLTKGMSYARECMLLYGGGTNAASNLGVVLNTTGTSGTSLVIQMAAADWATAIWAGSENGQYDIYSSAGTKRNTAGTTSDTVYVLAGVDAGNYRLTFTSHATNVAAVVATDQIFFAGARGNDALGFVAAASTTSGSLWGINVGTYGLWKPTQIPVGGAMTFAAVSEGGARVASTGYYGDYTLYVNPATFADICDDQTALIQHTQKQSGKLTIGFDDVVFKTQAGSTRLAVHPYMKRGIALGIPDDSCMRVGASDITHTMPGYGKMFRELENAAGIEMRLWTDQAPFCNNPQYLQIYTGITNSTD